jgi:hypothetical protein
VVIVVKFCIIFENGFESWVGSGMVDVGIVFSTKCEDLNDG